MTKDLEYLAAANFMRSNYYLLPEAESSGLLHVLDHNDAAWQALEGTPLAHSTKMAQALAQTVCHNLFFDDLDPVLRERQRIGKEIKRVNRLIDQQG